MKKTHITLIVILISILFVYITISMRTQTTYKDLNKQIDSLQHSIEINHTIIESYDEKIEIIKDSIVKLDNKVAENNKQIENLDKEYDKKFDSIATFYSSDFQEYISKRYENK